MRQFLCTLTDPNDFQNPFQVLRFYISSVRKCSYSSPLLSFSIPTQKLIEESLQLSRTVTGHCKDIQSWDLRTLRLRMAKGEDSGRGKKAEGRKGRRSHRHMSVPLSSLSATGQTYLWPTGAVWGVLACEKEDCSHFHTEYHYLREVLHSSPRSPLAERPRSPLAEQPSSFPNEDHLSIWPWASVMSR